MKKIATLFLIILTTGCAEKDDFFVSNPEGATLIFPENNQECNQGVDVPDTDKSTVIFMWEATDFTDSYDVIVKNLDTQTNETFTATTNELPIAIKKGTPFSWYVVSRNSSVSQTAQSEVWKFYNAGEADESYAPFPAELVSPDMASVFTGISTQTIVWQGYDVDNDIIGYDVYVDTAYPPIQLVGSTTEITSMDVEVEPGNTYYWRVITNDGQGNSSQSQVFDFRVE